MLARRLVQIRTPMSNHKLGQRKFNQSITKNQELVSVSTVGGMAVRPVMVIID